jgi:hypothetical protein
MTFRAVVVASTMLIIGCGGGSSGNPSDGGAPQGMYQTAQGFCTAFPKLTGGDLVGTWTVFAACGISTNAPANCPGTTLSLSLGARGTVTFNADMTDSIDVTVDLKKTSTVDVTCPSAGDCPSLQSHLAIEVGADGGASATCAPSSTDPARCACEQIFAPLVRQGSGTYRFQLPGYLVSGDLQLQGGYLVQGDTLRLDGVSLQGTQFDLIARR